MPDPIEELQNPGKAKKDFMRYLRHEFITLNFYRAHMLYFICVIAISSVIVYGVGVTHGPKEYRNDHLTYMDALFLCTSAMTTTGTKILFFPWIRELLMQDRLKHSGLGRPFGVSARSPLRSNGPGQHTICLSMGCAHTADFIPKENGQRSQALAYNASTCRGYRAKQSSRARCQHQ
jgi:hypothetical protein